MPDYRVALLHRLGFPVTKENLRFLATWQAHEGGATHNDATYNWFNTTKGSQFPSINSVGVRAFPDFQTGIDYTAQTINNGRYPDIVAGLKAGNPYAAPIADDLSVWVSGSPTKGLKYASRVLGGKFVEPSKKLANRVADTRTQADPGMGGLDAKRQALMSFFMASNQALMEGGDQPNFAAYIEPMQQQEAPSPPVRRTQAAQASKGVLVLPSSWKGTHVTDNLGWNTKSASDIMGRPGTPVGAPEDGVIVRHGSAQGGQSVYFRGVSGKEFWIGHIADALPEGTKVRRGQPFAVISADHPRPHAHIDKR